MESTHSFSVRASRSAVHTSLAPPNLRGNPLIPLLLDLKNTISFCLFPAYRIFSMRDFDPLHSAIEFDWQLCFVSSFPVVSVGGSAKSSLSGRRQVATLPGHHSCDTVLSLLCDCFLFPRMYRSVAAAQSPRRTQSLLILRRHHTHSLRSLVDALKS